MTLETLKQLFKFSWAQAFSDHTGKSSVMAVSSFVIIITGCTGFLYALYIKEVNGMMYSSAIITVGAGMLSYRKKINGKGEVIDIVEPGTVQQTIIETPPITTTQTTITPPEQ